MKPLLSMLLTLLMCSAGLAAAEPERRGPPQEFLEACKGKKEGVAVSAKSPRGDMVKGTCRMVMMPDHPPGGRPDGEGEGRRPPPKKDQR